MKRYRFTALALVALTGTCAIAQEATTEAPEEKAKVETTICADIVTNYIWRGQKLGEVGIQPTLGIGYKGLSLAAWGHYGLSNPDDTKEFDITLSYTTGGLNVGITDYFFSNKEDQEKYFMYEAHKTAHIWEAFIGYDFGFLSAHWYTNFAGNDGFNKSEKRAYSSYFELNAPFRFATCEWKATAAIVPYATDLYGTTGFAVTNLSVRATKDIKVTDTFSIPIFGQLTANPCSQKAYLVLGFTLQP